MPAAIRFFMPDAPYGWLCALSPHAIRMDGLTWPTAEHYYQARKFVAHPAVQMEILGTIDPFIVKRIAQRERARRPADWHPEKSLAAFRAAMRAKFAQHAELAAQLLATGDMELVEDSSNNFWGCGADKDGENWCGRILMEIRAELSPG